MQVTYEKCNTVSQLRRRLRPQQQQQQLDSSFLQRLHGVHKSSSATRTVHCSVGMHSMLDACTATASLELVASVPAQQWEAGSSAAPAAAPASLHRNRVGQAAGWSAAPVAPPYSSIGNGMDGATGSKLMPVTAAAASAATKTNSTLDGSSSRSLKQQQKKRQSHAVAQPDCSACSRVWLPAKQLWVAGSDDAPAPSNSSGTGAASTTTQLQCVFMAAAAVSCICAHASLLCSAAVFVPALSL